MSAQLPVNTVVGRERERTGVPKPLRPTDPEHTTAAFGPRSSTSSTSKATPIGVFDEAEKAIAILAGRMGLGAPTGSVHGVPGGAVCTYGDTDIYWSKTGGTHEVHGEIRKKYDLLGGAGGSLGLPTTDESEAGGGRYNHFVGGSIYWSPATGPMSVHGAVRDTWAAEGWERGGLRFPVDEQHMMSSADPNVIATSGWQLFENGAIFTSSGGTADAIAAEATPDGLRAVVRRSFDTEIHKGSDKAGLHPQIDTVSVSDWTPDLWRSGGRRVTFRLYGFAESWGPIPDIEFTIDVELSFGLVWPDQTGEPTKKTLVAGLSYLRVHASGVGHDTAVSRLESAVRSAFYPSGFFAVLNPRPAYLPDGWRVVTEISTGAQQDGASIDVLDVLVTADGGLQVLLNPIRFGDERQHVAQGFIDDLVLGVSDP